MIKTNPVSVANLQKFALKVRANYNVNPGDAFPIYDYICNLEDQGLLSIQVLDNDDPYLSESTVACYNATDNFIYVKEQLLDDLENNVYHANFTLAHELFHFFQFKVLNFNFEEVETRPAYCDPEWQANEFAGELLMPLAYLNNNDDEYLSNHFKVSVECVLTRKVKNKKRVLSKRAKEANQN